MYWLSQYNCVHYIDLEPDKAAVLKISERMIVLKHLNYISHSKMISYGLQKERFRFCCHDDI